MRSSIQSQTAMQEPLHTSSVGDRDGRRLNLHLAVLHADWIAGKGCGGGPAATVPSL